MLLKASRRAGSFADAQDLLDHLLKGEENERVIEVDGPGMVADLINDARAITTKPYAVWHVSLSPTAPLTPVQWERARAVLLDAYDARPDLPSIYVEHAKPHRQRIRKTLPARCDHRHLVFPTQDPITGTQIDPYKHYLRNERAARQLEYEFGHPLTPGKHSDKVHRWFLENGRADIAQAMEAAGLLEHDPSEAKVTDRERNMARRTGRDPFAAVDATASALVLAGKAKGQTPGAAFRQSLADEGFVLVRGSKRLLLVPVDGGKPVSAARKAGKKDAELRALLGSEIDRLPTIEPGQDVAAWLRALSGQAPTPTDTGEHHARKSTQVDPGLDRRQAGRHPRRRGSRRTEEHRQERDDRHGLRNLGRSPSDPPSGKQARRASEAQRSGGEPAGSGAPTVGDSGDGSASAAGGGQSELDRTRPDASPERRRPTRYEQARLSRIAEQHLGQHRDTIAAMLEQVRQPPDPARVQRIADQIVAARRRAAEVVRVPELESPVRGIELADPERVHSMVGERKKVWILMAIRKQYDTGWLPPAVVQHITGYEYDRQAREVILTLDTGAKIRDGMTKISLDGQIDQISVTEMVEAVRRRGWESVTLTGDLAFQRAAAFRLALLEPPVSVVGSQLSAQDLKEVEKIAVQARPAAPLNEGPAPFGIRL